MKRLVTTLFALLVLAAPSWGQTIKEIKAISAQIEGELLAAGETLTEDEFETKTQSTFTGQEITFTGVVLTDPLNSGNSSSLSRIHVFLRDTSAVHDSAGMLGYGIQVVDGNWETNGWGNIAPGYVVKVTADVTYFGAALQLTPSTVEVLALNYASLGLPDSIMDPVDVDIADLNQPVTFDDPDSNIENQITVNFGMYDLINEEYVRLQGATVLARTQNPTGRPNWVVTNGDKTAHAQIYDISLRYRNDRSNNDNYLDAGFNVRDDEFVPPPTGATVNLQGFAYPNFFDPYNIATPDNIMLAIVPFEDSDLEVTETPPSFASIDLPEGVISPDADVSVSADVNVDDSRTLTSVVLDYTTSGGASGQVALAAGATNGDGSVTYTGNIPAGDLDEGDFVSFTLTATDNTGASTTTEARTFVATGQINSIAQIQTTEDGGAGDSPFTGTTVADGSGQMNIEAVVMSDPSVSGFIVVQDDASLAPWTGIFIEPTSELEASLEMGDRVTITGGTIEERFGVTQIADVTLTETGTGEPYAYKTVTTNILQDSDVAEAHEGMMLRFENVTITDADAGFGEWKFSSDGSADTDVRADDASDAIGRDFAATTFGFGDTVAFMQGVWWYSFGNYKLVPESTDDVGETNELITIKKVKEISEDVEDALDAAGADLDEDTFETDTQSEYTGQEITFTAVVLTDPLNSGNSSSLSRIHVFVRDTTAAQDPDGMLGYGIQIVDGNWETNGWGNVAPGYVVKITADVTYFGAALQLTPSTVEVLATDYAQLGLPDEIMEPITVDLEDLNQPVPYVDQDSNIENQITINFEDYDLYNEEYVRIEGAQVLAREQEPTGRPNWVITNGDQTSHAQIYDISLRYRNDRSSNDNYTDAGFNVRDDEFVPPGVGSTVNLQGFAYPNFFDAYGIATPDDIMLAIVPFEDSDLEVTEQATVITALNVPTTLSTPDADIVISADVKVDASRSISVVTLSYKTEGDTPADGEVTMTAGASNDDGSVTYTGSIPAADLDDGDFVYFDVIAEDNTGAEAEAGVGTLRVLAQVTNIAQIQTAMVEPGASPLEGVVAADGQMDIQAVVMSDPSVSGFIVVQDDASLAPWTGIFIEPTSDLMASLEMGDRVTITGGTIEERFGVTQIADVTLTETGTGEPYAYKTVPTSVLQDDEVAEAHEGMMLRFENVTITDADAGFGEWKFSSDGTEDNDVRADDASDALGRDFASTTFEDGAVISFMQGIWWYSFGNYKLVPESTSDIGSSVANEGDNLPDGFTLAQNAPNPFSNTTTIRFTIEAPVDVSLTVYDLMGRRVATLVEGRQAAGEQTVTFNANGLASGVYVYRLRAGDTLVERKMMVVK